MTMGYSSKSSAIRPYKLTDEQHAGIGRLIRACAEIEDIINLRLADLVGVHEGMILVFLGRTPVSKRLKTLEFISGGKGAEAERLFEEAFDNEAFRHLQAARNTFAHGTLLGMTDDGEIAFSVVEFQGIDEKKLHSTVHSFKPEAFGIMAQIAEDVIPQMEEAFGLKALRETRLGKEIAPHAKSSPKAQRGSALSRQRKASQASDKAAKLARKQAQRDHPSNRKKED